VLKNSTIGLTFAVVVQPQLIENKWDIEKRGMLARPLLYLGASGGTGASARR
jgi:hypothetical protein